MATKYSQADIDEARRRLMVDLRIIPGTVVYTNLRHVSSSRTTRHISVHIVHNGAILDITRDVSRVLGLKVSDKTYGLIVGGAGMNMGFHIVYSLSRALYRDGFPCIGRDCPSNDHTNDFGDFSRRFEEEYGADFTDTQAGREHYCAARGQAFDATEAERYSSSRMHSDGGYALLQCWL